jgi:S-adenosylmethionine decarboxylase
VAALGSHLLIEAWGVDPGLLNDAACLERLLIETAKEAGCEVLGSLRHSFVPQGASAVVLISESHLSIHTWPERGYAAVDMLTCGSKLDQKAVKTLISGLKPAHHEVLRLERGRMQTR